jgi:hypothetical protein
MSVKSLLELGLLYFPVPGPGDHSLKSGIALFLVNGVSLDLDFVDVADEIERNEFVLGCCIFVFVFSFKFLFKIL